MTRSRGKPNPINRALSRPLAVFVSTEEKGLVAMKLGKIDENYILRLAYRDGNGLKTRTYTDPSLEGILTFLKEDEYLDCIVLLNSKTWRRSVNSQLLKDFLVGMPSKKDEPQTETTIGDIIWYPYYWSLAKLKSYGWI